jgi:ferrous iron transport protein B
VADLTLALAGNPNAGKSTIFNALTGLHQHVGNWPGKTVEKRIGVCRHNDLTLDIVDLPGTYSLTAYSPEELVARDYVIHEHPDAVIVVIDATNLERNLYLAVQILELGVPVVVALNMMDGLRANGGMIELNALSHALGNAPVIPTAANRGEGIDKLIETAIRVAKVSKAVET